MGPRRCASALTQRRPRADRPHKGARGCGGGEGGPPGTPRATRPGEGEPEAPDAGLGEYPGGLRNPGAVVERGAVGREEGKGGGRCWEAREPQREGKRFQPTTEQI